MSREGGNTFDVVLILDAGDAARGLNAEATPQAADTVRAEEVVQELFPSLDGAVLNVEAPEVAVSVGDVHGGLVGD